MNHSNKVVYNCIHYILQLIIFKKGAIPMKAEVNVEQVNTTFNASVVLGRDSAHHLNFPDSITADRWTKTVAKKMVSQRATNDKNCSRYDS
jgi:hypothetical protein